MIQEFCYLNHLFTTTFDTTINLQRKSGIGTKIKAIERESKKII